jgi:hypothetical protein
MALDFTTSVGYAAAQARERALAAQRQLQNQQQLADQSAIDQGTNANIQGALSEFEHNHEAARAQAFREAEARGEEAGRLGRQAPGYSTDETNRGAQIGAARGRMALGELVAKRQDAAAVAEAKRRADAEAASTKFDRDRQLATEQRTGTADIEKEKFTRETPITHANAMELQGLRNVGKVKAATAGNPGLSAGLYNTIGKDLEDNSKSLRNIDAALGSMDQLTDEDFGAQGALADAIRQGKAIFGQLSPEDQAKFGRVQDFKTAAGNYVNDALHRFAGSAQTSTETRNKYNELGMLWGGGHGMMLNNRGSMRRALQLIAELGNAHQQSLMEQMQSGTVMLYYSQYGGHRAAGSSAVGQGGGEGIGTSAPTQGVSAHQPALDEGGINPTGDELPMAPAPGELPSMPAPEGSEPPAYQTTPSGIMQQAPASDGDFNHGTTPTNIVPQSESGGPPTQTRMQRAADNVRAKLGAKKKPAASRKQQLDELRANAQGDDDAFVEAALKAGYSDAEIHPYIAE